MVYLILVLVIIVPIGYYISVYNDIQRLSVKIDEAFANIDVALAKRYQVLTQLFEVAKGYAKHEKETIVAIVKVRQGMSLDEKEEAMETIEREYSRFFAISESYPELKADQLFLNLQHGIRDTEEHLQAARRLYNSNVSRFNQRIQTFPGNQIANSHGHKAQKMLQFNPEQLQDVNLRF